MRKHTHGTRAEGSDACDESSSEEGDGDESSDGDDAAAATVRIKQLTS